MRSQNSALPGAQSQILAHLAVCYSKLITYDRVSGSGNKRCNSWLTPEAHRRCCYPVKGMVDTRYSYD